MIYFNNDYSEGCHPAVLEKLIQTNLVQTPGYGMDSYCKEAADRIRMLCNKEDLSVHFLVGGTQTNLTVISAALRPYQAVISAASGHINVHETGAIEACGHKIIALPAKDGKITARQIDVETTSHFESADSEHMAQPGMVYISHPTEYGTLYTLEELRHIHDVCRKHGLLLFLDGARLGYGLAAPDTDVTLEDLANLCDVFYIGGTKVGTLFGEAVVIANPALDRDFRYMIKQKGGMLAKGRLLGVQFGAVLESGLYIRLGKHANCLADRIRQTLSDCGYRELVETTTNQVFPVLPDSILTELSKDFCFTEMERVDESHRCVRFCTSWATTEENVGALCRAIVRLSK